ncbi:DUF4349 domain-containing protein [Methanohalophilus sp.]|uniref:DUF4349 domain-containing protein n=1 Tax=Methanohalophilus sp. TaxID=1966352 RepID=UPI00262F7C4E|nr:DUF4349 domain-containing protein [Methanohalophilus sp.]MDK2891611.1 hypothetical protein [Methanohalophilus sp.]
MKYKHLHLILLLLMLSIISAGCLSLGGDFSSSISEKQIGGGYDYRSDLAYEEAIVFDESTGVRVEYESPISSDTTSMERQVIKTVDLSLRVENATTAAEALADIANSYGGYISSSSVYDSYYYESYVQKQGYVNLRIPAEKLDDALGKIKDLGEIQSESSSAQDVTEEYIDLNARLSNMEKQEERLLEILDMATTVQDVLEVEKELERLRGEIESLQGRLNYLNSQIDMTTVNVYLTEPAPLGGSLGIRNAISDAVQGFIISVRGIIVFMGYVLPVVIVLSAAGGIIILAVRRKKK